MGFYPGLKGWFKKSIGKSLQKGLLNKDRNPLKRPLKKDRNPKKCLNATCSKGFYSLRLCLKAFLSGESIFLFWEPLQSLQPPWLKNIGCPL